MNSINVKIINQLKDNYSFILYNDSGDASIIDPAESLPIIDYVNKNSLKITYKQNLIEIFQLTELAHF